MVLLGFDTLSNTPVIRDSIFTSRLRVLVLYWCTYEHTHNTDKNWSKLFLKVRGRPTAPRGTDSLDRHIHTAR